MARDHTRNYTSLTDTTRSSSVGGVAGSKGSLCHGFVSDGRALCPIDVNELASDVGHARDLADRTRSVQVLETCIAVGT